MTFLTKSEIWKRQTVQYISKVMNATHFIRIVAIVLIEVFMSWMRTVALFIQYHIAYTMKPYLVKVRYWLVMRDIRSSMTFITWCNLSWFMQ